MCAPGRASQHAWRPRVRPAIITLGKPVSRLARVVCIRVSALHNDKTDTVSRGHLENRDPAAMHRFLGFPRRSGTAMHHFLNGLPQLPHTISVERGFVRIARHQGPDPSRSDASHLDFPLETASEAFNPANFFAARPSSCTVSYPETGKCVARFLNVAVS